MLKGHSVIELTDVNTGEVERYEDDNLVTNGIKYYQQFWELPDTIWKTVFGGVKIFENNIEENPDVVVAPPAANMIGYACDYSDTTDNMRGILNLDQSGILEDNSGIKLTWDFAQNQANGTIRCICITPEEYAKGPKIGLVNYSSKSLPRAYYMTLIGYDPIRRVAISCENEIKTNNRFKIVLNKMPILYRGITDDGSGGKLEEFYVDVPAEFRSYKDYGTYIGCEGIHAIFLAIKDYATTSPASTSFVLMKINKITYEVTTQEFSFSDPAYPDTYFSSTDWSFLFNGYLYIYYADDKYFKFQLEDFTLEKVIVYEKFKDSLNSTNSFLAIDKHGVTARRFSIGTDDVVRISDYANVSTTKYPSGVLLDIAGGICFASNSKSSASASTLCLSRKPVILTINNLATPVTKTADKTMKITYVLKEDYSDSPTQPTS